MTSFVGRRRERAEIRSALAAARLVTLTGFGGVGKTRLALSVATELRRAFADGAYFVSLGPLEDPEMLAQAVAAAIGMQVRPKRSPADSLVDFLRTRQVLLVLDNCEHVIEAAAVLTDELLRSCPRLRVLATSREPLRIDGETVHAVVPLSVPAAGLPLHQCESVGLFVDRARSVAADFALTPANQDDVAAICRHLEGIPLAIELAAVRLRTMSPAQLAGHLAEHWTLLTRGSRVAPARQRTMAACIEWSFTLCSEAERDVWAGVSTFSGGFELDAAEAICGELSGDEEFGDVLAALVEKSILVAERKDGVMRFRVLPPIRHRGLSRLAELGRITELRRRHRDWYVALAVRASDEWLSPAQVDWILRLRREEGNVQTALGFCFSDSEEAVPGLLMGSKLMEFGLAQGLFQAGRVWFARLFPLAPQPTLTRALALRTAIWWAAAQGEIATATEFLREGQRLASSLGEPVHSLYVQTSAFVALFAGDADAATTLFEDAIVRLRAAGDLTQTAQSLYLLALAHAFQGRLDRALECHEQCLAITVPAGETWMRTYSLWVAGFAHWQRGDGEEADRAVRQSLEFSRRINDRVVVGLCLEALAWMAAGTSPERSATLLGAAAHQWDRVETSTAALGGLYAHHEACVSGLDERLGEEALNAAWAHGKALTTWDATRYALGESTPTGPAERRAAAAILTKREAQIAELVAQGLNNRDIADMLVISKRTAETHVEHILTKLGFTSRHQITAWMGDSGLRT